MEDVAGLLLRGPVARAARNVAVIPTDHLIAGFQSALFGFRAGFDGSNGPSGVRFALQTEAQRGDDRFFLVETETGLRK
jgi:hypothetical protein